MFPYYLTVFKARLDFLGLDSRLSYAPKMYVKMLE